jgi:hypothetical protein
MSEFLDGMLSEDDIGKVKEELCEVYRFLELTEAFTTDFRTGNRIRIFLEEKGLWKKAESNKL